MEGDTLTSFRESVRIAAPPDRVWRLITDIRRHPEFAGPKSITKEIPYEGDVAPGRRFVAHERFGLQKFDAPSDITVVEPHSRFEWVSWPPMKEQNRGEGGRVVWGYELRPVEGGSELTHHMTVLEPRKGAGGLRLFYRVFRLPKRQVTGGRTTLNNIKAAAEQG